MKISVARHIIWLNFFGGVATAASLFLHFSIKAFGPGAFPNVSRGHFPLGRYFGGVVN